MWTTFNGSPGNGKIRLAVSRDRGQTFSKAITITPPGTTTPATTYVYPSVGVDGTLYVAFVGGFDTKNKNRVGHVFVTKSVDDGMTFGPFVQAATPSENPDGFLPNTNFRDGIIENFTASPTYPGHVYLTYEDWDAASGQFDVKFTQSTDGGLTGRPAQTVNDAPNSATTDQFQPSVAAGPGGAVAVAFYDRRADCPTDPSILPAHSGPRTRASTSRCRPTRTAAPRRRGAGRRQRPRLAVHLGSRPAQQKVGRDHPVRLRRPRRPVPAGTRLHRRLLRARDLGGATSTRSGSPPTTRRRPSSPTTAARSTTRTRCWESCPGRRSEPGTELGVSRPKPTAAGRHQPSGSLRYAPPCPGRISGEAEEALP